ncbi:MAG: HlyC/CorC family transporter [Verrucomicrobia bacterium]|nr:HlyC/CorC family transporter [Verrucomicrobiota bacterium]
MDPILVIALKLLAVAGLVLLNGFFVAAEFALVKIRDTQLEPLITKGRWQARVARRVLHNLDRSLSAAQLGITLASLGLGWIGEPVFTALLKPVLGWLQIESPAWQHSLSFAVGFTTITFLHIVAGEQAPKWLAIQKPLPSSMFVALPLELFCRLAYPFIWVLNQSSLWLLRQIGIETTGEHEMAHSEEELRLLFTASQKGGHGTQLGRDIVLNALDLRHRVIRDVMRPRKEIVAFSTESSVAECLDLAEKSRFSRFPLCEGGDLDKILGVIHIKDLFAMRLKARCGAELRPAARRIIYVPETARLEKALQLLLDRKLHLAIVVDEFGGTIGMVTLENILEELVGQIQDEFDQEKPLLVKKDEHSWNVDGALPLRDLEAITGERIPVTDVATVSGWVTQELGGFPKPGDVLTIGPHELRVQEMDGVRVSGLSLNLRPPPPPTAAVNEPGS